MSTKPQQHQFVLPNLTRTPAQRAQFEEINSLGICPFCSRESFTKFHKGEVIFENASWILSTNDTPYVGTKTHLLLVFQGRHVRHLIELTENEWGLLLGALKFASEKFEIDSGAFLMRFGTPGNNGASVEHLHAHIISGAGEMSDTAPRVKVKIGYGKE